MYFNHFRSKTFINEILPTISKPGFFNLTSTFRSDSDFHQPYLKVIPGNFQLKHASEILQIKTNGKIMAWYVSHCKAESKREDYVNELSKYIHLDKFGHCGSQIICGRNKPEPCLNDSLEEYKFYFAAENSICKEYFTGMWIE